jgi:hypothetical protein
MSIASPAGLTPVFAGVGPHHPFAAQVERLQPAAVTRILGVLEQTGSMLTRGAP